MYSPLQLAWRYARYYFTALNGRGHGMHSPFVFDFITKVLNDATPYPGYELPEKLRRQLLSDQRLLTVNDLGAGSAMAASRHRSVASIARHAAKPGKYGRLLYRMARYYRPSKILELGTSLGITTTYLSLAGEKASVLTLEGAREVAAVAREQFEHNRLNNIRLEEGDFDDTLLPALERLSPVDLVFLDGNHRLEPTLRYFRNILPHIHNDTILVFDDIHWSREMETAWQQIQAHEAVRCTIDLFFIGIVLFRSEFREKQHFTIRF